MINKIIILRRTIYIALGMFDEAVDRKNDFVILCYHSLDNDGWRFSVRPKEFKKQIKYMLKHYSHTTLSDLIRHLEKNVRIKKPCFLLTFDDGYKNLLRVAPFLKELDINPALFVVSDRKNPSRKSIGTKKSLLSNKDLIKLARFGWDIESHGKTHTVLTKASNDNLGEEIIDSKKDLEKILRKKAIAFSYPHGKYSEQISKIVRKADYKVAFSMDDTLFSSKVDKYAIPRIGVDGTHEFDEFKYLFSPSSVFFRRLIKLTPVGRFL